MNFMSMNIIKLIIINYNISINNKDIMNKMFKIIIIIIISIIWTIELITMNENSNGIISRKIIGRLFNILVFVYEFLSRYLNYKFNDKIVIKLLNIGCSLDYALCCNNYALLFTGSKKLKYLKKGLKLDPTNNNYLHNIYYYYMRVNNKENAIKYFNKITDKDMKRFINILFNLNNYDIEKIKIYKNDYDTYKNPKNLEQKKIKVYSYLINGILFENQSNITEQKKYYDYFLNNLIHLNNFSSKNKIAIPFKTFSHFSTLISISVTRIYYYGLSSEGKDIKKAKNILRSSPKDDTMGKFWKDEYNKINNHKL